MIKFAAIKKDGIVYVGKQCQRHDNIINDDRKLNPLRFLNGVQGFVDESGKFYNRHDAAIHAFECGQLPNDDKCPETIISEDLW
jgi:hypothetical protein